MPRRKNPLAGSLNKLLVAHATDETTQGTEFIDIPGGIGGGVARLVEAKLNIYKSGDNKGKKFMYFAGVVIDPKTAIATTKVWEDGKVKVLETKEVQVEGQRTSVMIPLCDTTNTGGEVTTEDEHVGRALNELRKLGGDECTAEIETEEDLVSVLEALKEEGPHFKFSTTSGDPNAQYPTNPRVWHNWFGTKGLEEYVPESSIDVVDETPPTATREKSTKESTPKEEEPDSTALAKAAEGGDTDAEKALTQLALDAGATKKAVENAKSWGDVAALIGEPSGGGDLDPSILSGDDPEVGDVFGFKPPRKKKPVEVEVTAADTENQTVDLKTCDSPVKTFEGIPWGKLTEV